MSELECASRDLNRDIISRTLEATEGEEFNEMSIAVLKVTFDSNERTFDKICNLQAGVLAGAVGQAGKIAARNWLRAAEMDYKIIRMRLSERIAQLEQAGNHEEARNAANERQRFQVLGPPEGLGVFDGTHVNWPAFRDLFTALVDSRNYPTLSKLLYLKKACTGAASLALSGYDPLQDCYQDAWNALRAIYDDNYAVAQALIDRILDMPRAKDGEVGELRRIIDTTTSTLRQLVGLGHAVESWSALIVNLMTRKLPARIVEQWEQLRRRGENPDLDDLIEYLEGKARLRLFGDTIGTEATEGRRSVPGGSRGARATEGFNKRRIEQPTARFSKSRLECRYCGKDHWLAHCTDLKAKAIPERERILSRLGVCFNCLNFGHRRGLCQRRGCNGGGCNGDKHHWILCPGSRSNVPNPQVRVAMNEGGTR